MLTPSIFEEIVLIENFFSEGCILSQTTPISSAFPNGTLTKSPGFKLFNCPVS